MDILSSIITGCYYVFTALIVLVLILNFKKSKDWQNEALYIIVLIPFLLRLFRLK